jgi:hypothetical protein
VAADTSASRRSSSARHGVLSCSSSGAAAQILVNYAKRQVGNKVYAVAELHLPLKSTVAG